MKDFRVHLDYAYTNTQFFDDINRFSFVFAF